ncbi:SAM-dependent methyltransferase [Vibrio albus]|jgi:predicted TPR repeat methyltransferase|uniref:SAM-dependent methyltransferase n=1 Tax=Vibrio albus TaxID=2200953 RepID=A0A2U3B8U7_9VIBR|nr:methyltransferase domain-containing protein [Vibrio albus]PWI33229.1 SAM-dependent methyltransferase [Vibrio albus]
MVRDWDKCATEWEKDTGVALYTELAFAELQQLIDIKRKRFFDFGCGTGLLSQKLSPLAKDIVALDKSEAMIEELDKKYLENVEPVVDHLSRGLVAQHPAFRGQFDCVVACAVCGYLDNFQEAAVIVHSLLEEEGLFVHWDYLAEDGKEGGLSQQLVDKVLRGAGFENVAVSVPFEIETEEGPRSVLMGIGEK